MILEAGALRLLPADTALAPRTAAYYARNRAFLRPFEPERPQAFFTVEGQRDILLRELLAAQGLRAYRFYIEPKCAPALVVGSIGLNDVVWGAFCSAFLGYKLDAAYTGKGYMRRLCAWWWNMRLHSLGCTALRPMSCPATRRPCVW